MELGQISFDDLLMNMRKTPAPGVNVKSAGLPENYEICDNLIKKMTGAHVLNKDIIKHAAFLEGLTVTNHGAKRMLDYAVSRGLLLADGKNRWVLVKQHKPQEEEVTKFVTTAPVVDEAPVTVTDDLGGLI